PILETERLLLRAVTPEDAADIFRIMGDPRVTRYFGITPMASLDLTAQRVDAFRTAFQEQTGVRWTISRRGSARLMGTCGYWRLIKSHFRAEIGYELAPEYWGQGVMTEAVGAVLTFGFTTMG